MRMSYFLGSFTTSYHKASNNALDVVIFIKSHAIKSYCYFRGLLSDFLIKDHSVDKKPISDNYSDYYKHLDKDTINYEEEAVAAFVSMSRERSKALQDYYDSHECSLMTYSPRV